MNTFYTYVVIDLSPPEREKLPPQGKSAWSKLILPATMATLLSSALLLSVQPALSQQGLATASNHQTNTQTQFTGANSLIADQNNSAFPNAIADSDNNALSIRGTTGSGAQDRDIPQEQSEATGSNQDLRTNATAPASLPRQVQGRARREQAIGQVTDPLITATPSARSNLRQQPPQSGVARTPESDPFAAQGLRIGTWRAFTALEQTVGYSTNLSASAEGEGGGFSQTDVNVSLQSDWSRHSARIDANGTLRQNFGGDEQTIPDAGVSGVLNLGLSDGYNANLGLQYNYATEEASSAAITAPAASRTGFHTARANAELTRTDRKLLLSLRGVAQRTVYEDIELQTGGYSSQSDRNNNLFTATARIGYEVSPALTPFVEGEYGIRRYDESNDRNGDNRDSTIMAARAGIAMDLGEKLSGEISAGYRVERFEDNNLEDLSALTIDGNLRWSPVRDINVDLTASTRFNGATTPGDSGSTVHSAGLTVSRQATDRLSLNAGGNVQLTTNRSERTDATRWTVNAGARYWINRFMALTGSVEHTNQQSDTASQNYDATSIRAGVRFQR